MGVLAGGLTVRTAEGPGWCPLLCRFDSGPVGPVQRRSGVTDTRSMPGQAVRIVAPCGPALGTVLDEHRS